MTQKQACGLILTADGQSSTVYAHTQKLPVGHYRWQVIYQDADGNDYGRSKARRFRLSGDLPALPMPDIAALKDRLAGVRPRLFLTGDRLQVIRRAVQRGEVPLSEYFFAAADAALREEPYAEPDGYTSGQFNVSDWRRIYRPGKVGTTEVAVGWGPGKSGGFDIDGQNLARPSAATKVTGASSRRAASRCPRHGNSRTPRKN